MFYPKLKCIPQKHVQNFKVLLSEKLQIGLQTQKWNAHPVVYGH